MATSFKAIILVVLAVLVLSAPGAVYGQMGSFRSRNAKPAGVAQPGGKAPGTASSGPVDITANILEFNKEENSYTAKGDVEIIDGPRKLNADYVRYYKDTEDAYAEGHVVFREEGDVINCEKMSLNLATKMGTIEKGRIFIKEGNFTVIGSEIEKLGENEYEVKKGQFTTCDMTGPEKPAWKFSAEDADITVEGFAKTKGMKFYILDQPVFYIPRGFFPVKSERQSGFLMPEIVTSSRDGMKLTESYYWAISKDKDATFYTQWIQNRGFRLGTEFRYALTENTRGIWGFSIIDDKDYGGTRWEVKGKHEQIIGNDLTLKANIDYVSDKDFVLDFAPTPAERAENLLKSTAYVEKPLNKSLLTVETAYFRNLTTKDNDSTFKYLPHSTFFTEYMPLMKNRFYTDFASDFTYFYRERGDRVARWGIEPRFRVPYSWNGLNFLMNATYYQTAYMVDRVTTESGSSLAERHTVRLEGSTNVQLIRNYNTSFLNLGQLQSVIKPQIQYTFIPNSSTSNIPSIDPYDRIGQQNTITYSFNHYLYGLTPASSREVSSFEVKQTYGLSGDLSASTDYKGFGKRFSDIDAKLVIFPKTGVMLINQTVWNTSGQGLTSMNNTVNYSTPQKYFMSLTHSYARDLINEVWLQAGMNYKVFDFRSSIRYSFFDQTWIDTLYQIMYRPGCWSLNLALIQSKRPNDTTLRLSIDLSGITRTGTGGIIP